MLWHCLPEMKLFEHEKDCAPWLVQPLAGHACAHVTPVQPVVHSLLKGVDGTQTERVCEREEEKKKKRQCKTETHQLKLRSPSVQEPP